MNYKEKIKELRKFAEENYLDDVLIDKNALDDECVKTPVQIDTWMRLEAMAKDLRDNISKRNKLHEAEMELIVRLLDKDKCLAFINKNAFELSEMNTYWEEVEKINNKMGKMTEQTVKTLVSLCPALIFEQKELDEASYLLSLFSIAVLDFDKKYGSINNLTKLFSANYFAKDSFTGKEMTETFMKGAKERLAKAIEIYYSQPENEILSESKISEQEEIKEPIEKSIEAPIRIKRIKR